MKQWMATVFLFFLIYPTPPLKAQAGSAKEMTLADLQRKFPITLQIEKSTILDPAADHPEQLAQANAWGAAPPIFGAFFGTLNGERHWHFGCMAENKRYEQNPCTDMPIGLHRARWIHNRELLEVLAYDNAGNVTLRYIDVTIDSKNPPPPNDPVEALPSFPGFFHIDQTERVYPLLVHVYGAVSLSFPVGALPARTNCDITSPFPNRTNVNCTTYPPIPINRGTVEVQASIDGKLSGSISCDAKWRWSKCSVLRPGFYSARWKDDSKSKIEILGLRNGKPKEVGFEVR